MRLDIMDDITGVLSHMSHEDDVVDEDYRRQWYVLLYLVIIVLVSGTEPTTDSSGNIACWMLGQCILCAGTFRIDVFTRNPA